MLTGILKPTSGEMSVLGYHPVKERCRYTKHIGVVFGQRTQLWWDIAVQESFKLLARIYDVPVKAYVERMEVFEEVLGLEKLLRTPVRKLSLGERMRCDLAASLLHQPEVLFLDEPTIGLDAVAKDGIRTFLKHVNKEFGTTIILTTHDLREIEELCARIIVLDHGVVVYDGSLETVRRMPGMVRRIVVDFVGDVPQEPLNGEFGGRVLFSQEGTRRMVGEFDPRQISSSELIRSLMAKYNVADVTIAEPNIEQVIMKIYKDGVP
jgi:ABC-2 type transport system ATP-binding protein